MIRTLRKKLLVTILAWAAVLVVAFPILWMILTSLKTEVEAVSATPTLFFTPTFENYVAIFRRSNYGAFALNSVIISFGATLLSLMLAIPAAYALAFYPTERARGILMWVLSTKMMPAVGVLVPIYIIFRDVHLIDSYTGLIVLFTIANLPVVIWMMYSFFRDVPGEILEAARLDGAGLFQEFFHVLLPISMPAIASTALLSVIFCWNEAFWSLNLSTTHAAPLTAFIASYSAPQGLFWAKLSAAAVLAVAPILLLSWLGQRHLVRGLTFGAVK